jgi:hypothetical protein
MQAGDRGSRLSGERAQRTPRDHGASASAETIPWVQILSTGITSNPMGMAWHSSPRLTLLAGEVPVHSHVRCGLGRGQNR